MCTEGRKVHRSAKTSTQKCKYGYKEVQVQLLSTCRGPEGAHRSTGAQTYREQCQHAHKEVHVSVYSASIHKYECWYTDVSRQTYRSIRHTSTAIRTGKSERKTNHSGVMPPSHPPPQLPLSGALWMLFQSGYFKLYTGLQQLYHHLWRTSGIGINLYAFRN